MRGRWIAWSTGIAVIVALIVIITLRWLPRGIPLSEDARNDIVGHAKLIYIVDTSNLAGRPIIQVQYFVLDLGISNTQNAVQKELDQLRSTGWHISESDRDGIVAYSDAHNSVAVVEPLDSYLQRTSLSDPYEGEAASKISNNVIDRDALILVKAQPRS